MKTHYFYLIAFGITSMLISGCEYNSNRKIKLAAYAPGGLMQEQVTTIQVAAAKKKGVAVINFQNKTGRSDLDWLEQGIAEMVALSLSQSRQINLFPPSKISELQRQMAMDRRLLSIPDEQLKLAKALRAENFICGQYQLTRDSLIIDLELHDGMTGNVLSRHSVKGSGLENVFTMVDQLTKNLRIGLQLTFRETREVDLSIADVSTHSLDAYKAYSQGVEALNKFYNEEAIQFFEKAIALDSTFASAYQKLATFYLQPNDLHKARHLLKKAVQFSQRAPYKERLRILASNAVVNGDYFSGIVNLQEIVAIYPEDDDSHVTLGNYYRNFVNNYEKAIGHYEAAVALNPQNKIAYNQLGYTYANVGKLDYAIEAFQKYIQLADKEPNPYDSMGEVLQNEGRINEAITFYQKALKKNQRFNPSQLHLASAYLDKGLTGKASRIAKYLLKNSHSADDRSQALTLLIKTATVEGDIKKAHTFSQQLSDMRPFDPSAVRIFNNYHPDAKHQSARLIELLEQNQKMAEKNELTLDQLMSSAIVCLSMKEGLPIIDNLFDDLLSRTSEPVPRQMILGFRWAIRLCYDEFKAPPAGTDFMELLQKLPPIAWENYWRFYYHNLQNQHDPVASSRQDLKELRDKAQKADNTQFLIAFTISLAMLDRLEDNIEDSKAEMHSIGVPAENYFQFYGPFNVTKGVNQSFWPEEEKVEKWNSNQIETWMNMNDAQLDGYINFKEIFEMSFNQCGYALLKINSADSRDVLLRFGANRPVKAWLNNNLVLRKNLSKQACWDEYKIPAQLRAGSNWLLIKMTSVAGECGFYFRITDLNGKTVRGVVFGESLSA